MSIRKRESGASAVEFALIFCVVVVPMMFGIVQYGLFFNDSLQARQGVRQAARTGVVLGTISCDRAEHPAPTGYAGDLQCLTAQEISPVTGSVQVQVFAPDGWKRGNPLVVCATVDSAASSGILPVPDGGVVHTKTQMSIEQDSPGPTGSFPSTPGAGGWSWCQS